MSLKSDNQNIPLVATLGQNYPNPFNGSTKIKYGVPKDSKTELKIYNIKGQLVKVLLNAPVKGGYHTITWDGKDSRNKAVSSGIYFMAMKSNNKKLVRKTMVLK